MSQPLALLKRTEKEIAALLVAGLATQRGGRERLEELAREVSALKMERLAVELRKVAAEQDPAVLASSAFTALAMARKLHERLTPWPQLQPGLSIPFAGDPSVRIGSPANPAPPSLADLAHWMESGNELLRAHAATLLLQRGEESVPELARLAAKATLTVRREAIATLGKIGGEAALATLLGLLGDSDCWRALLGAVLLHGERAVPPLAAVVAPEAVKKGQETRRRMAAALLYRLGADQTLQNLLKDEDPVVNGFAMAALTRIAGRWQDFARNIGENLNRLPAALTGVAAITISEATADPGRLIEELDRMAVNEARAAARWVCGSPLERPLAEHYLWQLSSGATAKDRQRAAGVLRGLACPSIVTPLAGMVEAGEVDLASAAEVLGDTGGGHAVGILLDLVHDFKAPTETLKALAHLGDPGTAPPILEMLATSPHPESLESLLVALGDGAVHCLAAEMRAREGTELAGRLQQILMQIKTPRAREALKGRDTDSVEALISRLGHSKLGPDAARALARHGEAILDELSRVLLESRDFPTRYNALAALAAIKGTRALDLLLAVVDRSLRNVGDPTDRATCARGMEILAGRRDERATPLLVRGLASGVYNVQQAAARALVAAGKGVVPQVMPLLEARGPSTRVRALEVLGKLGATEAEVKAIELLSDSDVSVAKAAATALGLIGSITGNPRVVEALGIALERDTSGWPAPLVEALICIEQRAAIPYLRRFAQAAPSRSGPMGSYLARRAQEAIEKIEAASPPPSAPPEKGLMGRLKGMLGGR